MLLRVLALLIVAAAVGVAVWSMRTPALLRVPESWRKLAQRHPAMARALDLRQRIAKLMLKGRGTAAQGLVDDLDALLGPLARSLELKDTLAAVAAPAGGEAAERFEQTAARIDEGAQRVITHFEEALAAVVELAGAELALEAGPIRERLHDEQSALRSRLEGVRGATAFLDDDREA